MKKKYLTYAGIAAAGILIVLFIGIALTGSFTFFPTAGIDPITDLRNGDMLVITGTTNLPPGTDVLSVLGYHVPRLPDADPAVSWFGGSVSIVQGTGFQNTWSFAMDTTTLAPGEYIVNISRIVPVNASDASYRNGELLATSRFNLIGAASALAQPGNTNDSWTEFITVNSPGTRQLGEKFFLNGTTSLPAGTDLLLSIIQRDNVAIFTIDPKTQEKTEKTGHTDSSLLTVIPGTDGINRWSTVIDTTDFIPGYYLVNISNIKGTFEARNITEGDVCGTSFLIVEEMPANRSVSAARGSL